MQENLKYREEERIRKEEQAKYEEENKPHPYEKEIGQCDTFISYLEKKTST